MATAGDDAGTRPRGWRSALLPYLSAFRTAPELLPLFPVICESIALTLEAMKDFSNASFSPEAIKVMDIALQSAVDALPDPVSSHVIHRLAETILRLAREGECDPRALQRLASLELQIGPES